jgi:ribosome-binding protein aMBF1 (putative translation factor)
MPPRRDFATLIISDNMIVMPTQVASARKPAAAAKPTVRAKKARAKPTSPIGSTAEAASARRASESPEYRAQRTERQGFREIAWLLIKYRMDKGLTQEQLAEIVGTSNSQISRIESGRHRTNLDTLLRITRALDIKMLLGFERKTAGGRAKRDLVAL